MRSGGPSWPWPQARAFHRTSRGLTSLAWPRFHPMAGGFSAVIATGSFSARRTDLNSGLSCRARLPTISPPTARHCWQQKMARSSSFDAVRALLNRSRQEASSRTGAGIGSRGQEPVASSSRDNGRENCNDLSSRTSQAARRRRLLRRVSGVWRFHRTISGSPPPKAPARQFRSSQSMASAHQEPCPACKKASGRWRSARTAKRSGYSAAVGSQGTSPPWTSRQAGVSRRRSSTRLTGRACTDRRCRDHTERQRLRLQLQSCVVAAVPDHGPEVAPIAHGLPAGRPRSSAGR